MMISWTVKTNLCPGEWITGSQRQSVRQPSKASVCAMCFRKHKQSTELKAFTSRSRLSRCDRSAECLSLRVARAHMTFASCLGSNSCTTCTPMAIIVSQGRRWILWICMLSQALRSHKSTVKCGEDKERRESAGTGSRKHGLLGSI